MDALVGSLPENGTGEDIDLDMLLPSARKHQSKRRPPKKENIPILDPDLLFDDAFNNDFLQKKNERVEVTENDFIETKKTKKKDSIEENLINYLDKNLKDVKKAFIDELLFYTEKTFSLESFVDKYAKEISDEVTRIIAEEANHIKNDDIIGKFTNQISTQIEKIRKAVKIPKISTTDSDDPPLSFRDIDFSRQSFTDTLNLALNSIRTDRNELDGTREIEDKGMRNTYKSLRFREISLKEMEKQLDISCDTIDRRIQSLEEKQVEFRERHMKLYDFNNDIYYKSPIADSRVMISSLGTKISGMKQLPLEDISENVRREMDEIFLMLDQIIFRTDGLCQTIAKCRRIQLDDIRLQEEVPHNDISSILSGSVIDPNITQHDSNSIVNKVREKLKMFQSGKNLSQNDVV